MTDRVLHGAILAVTALAVALFALDLGGPVRVAVIVLFVLACPGVAWASALRTGDLADTLGIGIAISVALAAVIGQTMALAGWWSPGTGLALLVAITLGGVAVQRDRATG